jgi:hypothetical protein
MSVGEEMHTERKALEDNNDTLNAKVMFAGSTLD